MSGDEIACWPLGLSSRSPFSRNSLPCSVCWACLLLQDPNQVLPPPQGLGSSALGWHLAGVDSLRKLHKRSNVSLPTHLSTTASLCLLACHGQQRPRLTSRKRLEFSLNKPHHFPSKKVVTTGGTRQHLQMNSVPTGVIGPGGPQGPGGAHVSRGSRVSKSLHVLRSPTQQNRPNSAWPSPATLPGRDVQNLQRGEPGTGSAGNAA